MKITSAEFIKSAVKPSGYPREPLPQIAFAGRSNVGKSSLINSLTNRKNLARISSTPGRTQLLNFFRINKRIHFVDLPGYGFAKVPLSVKKNWDRMIVRYLQDNEHLKLLVSILDARRVPSDLDIQLMNWLLEYDAPFLFVVTKADKLSRSALSRQMKIIKETMSPPEGLPFIAYSSKTRLGKGPLLSAFDAALERTRPEE